MVSGDSIDHEHNMACHSTGQEYQHCIWGNMCHRHQHTTQGKPNTWTSAFFQAAAHTTYIYMALGGKMDDGNQCDPQLQHDNVSTITSSIFLSYEEIDNLES